MTKLMILYLLIFLIIALFAPIPKAQPQPQAKSMIMPLGEALRRAVLGEVYIIRYV